MRNFKRTLALVLAVIMVVGTFATVSAAEKDEMWYDVAVEALDKAGISDIGNTAAEPLTRNEFVMWIAKIESLQLEDSAWNDEIASVVFTDVNDTHHRAAIAYSYKANFIIGNGDGTFAPDRQLSLAEASAVIVRLMRYESKVTGLAEEWDMNYMRAASIYCQAFDQVFYKETKTFKPDFMLNKGQTAYILATILNFVKDGVAINPNKDDAIVTADGINLGLRFEGVEPAAKENVYYIANLDRKSISAVGIASVYLYGSSTGSNWPVANNEFNTASTVTLKSADNSKTIVLSGDEFAKLIRVSLGLEETRDELNEEAEINIFNTVKVGTMVEFTVENEDIGVGGVVDSYKSLKNFKVSSNSLVVDTVLQAGAISKSIANAESYVGYAAAALADSTNFIPVLPTSYDATMITTWTNVVYDKNGEVESATLNFKGAQYEYGTDIVAYDANWVKLSVGDAMNQVINTAQGEMYAVFNDTDADGLYDTIYVKESYPFAYTKAPNVGSVIKDSHEYMTSISNGAVVGHATPKYNSLGTVVWNQKVGYSNSTKYFGELDAHTQSSTDPFDLEKGATGKLQLVLCAANAHPLPKYFYDGGDNLSLYTVVDLANFYTGIIEEVDVHNVDGYYTAKVKTTDGAYVTVYIPIEPVEEVELDVTVAGATATYTFDCSAWGSFMTEGKEAAFAAGIAQPDNVVDGDSAEYLNFTAAWMAGKFVEFATNEEGIVICINGTEDTTGETGFVASVVSSETGDNTYNVTVAVTGVSVNDTAWEVATPYTHYLKTITDAHFTAGLGNWGITQYYHMSNANKDKFFDKIGGVYGIDANDDGVLDRDAEGYLVDDLGAKFAGAVVNKEKYSGVASFKTVEVRASASGMFDWANYNVYNQLFDGSLVDPNFVNSTTSGKVNAGTDLIYVTIMKDAGSLNYILYNAYADRVPTLAGGAISGQSNRDVLTLNGNKIDASAGADSTRWYYPKHSILALAAEDSWASVEGEYIIALEKVAGTETTKYHENGVMYVEAKYNATVGFNPYYFRSWDAQTKTYTYKLGFGIVKTMTDVIGTADAIVDTETSLLHPVFKYVTGTDSVHLKLTKAEDIKSYEDAGFFVDENGYVFTFVADGLGNTFQSIQYKKDKDNKVLYKDVVYNWADAKEPNPPLTDVLFDTLNATLNDEDKIGAYATLSIVEKPKDADGWFPGSYYVVVDGVEYNATKYTQVLLVTPSASGFATSLKTIEQLVASGKTNFFVTEWNAAIGADNVIGSIAIVGTDDLSKPVTDKESDSETDKTLLVYLDGSAKSVIRQDEYSKEWMVISDKSAYALPTGEEVGAIYRSYPTYAEALSASNLEIDLSVKGGKWYIINEDNEIVSSTDVKPLRGQITDVKADGTTVATMNGVKNVTISDMDTMFFYFDGEREVLYVAGENTNVSIIDRDSYNDLFATNRKNVAAAYAALYGYVAVNDGTGTHKIDTTTGRIVKASEEEIAKMDDATKKAVLVYVYDETTGAEYKYEVLNKLSDSRYAYYVNNLAEAEKALADAKAASLDKYFNGQFWGFANSPLYKYVAMAQGTFQEGKPTLYFDYVEVDGILCVFTDSFGFAG